MGKQKLIKGKLIVSGCSYTDNIWIESHGFTPWPELLAERLGVKCVNLGASGAGNEYILSSLMEMIFEKNIGLMIAMWTQPARMDFPCDGGRSFKGWVHVHMNDNQHFSDWKHDTRRIFRQIQIGTFPTLMDKSVRECYMFQLMMESLGIPYLQIQGCRPSLNAQNSLCVESLVQGKFTDKMNEDTFIGWPIMAELGGTSIDLLLDELDPSKKKLRISQTNQHPNEEGHKVIADYLHKGIEEEYGNL